MNVMREIPKYLLEKMVSLVQGSLSVEQFEMWLYEQDQLANQMETDDVIFEIYSFNYGQKGAKFVFERLMKKYLGEKYFQTYQIKKSLEDLIKDQSNLLSIVDEFYYLSMNDGYEFLSNIGYCYYIVEEYESYNKQVSMDVKKYIINESKVLLEQINKAIENGCRDLSVLDFSSRLSFYAFQENEKKTLIKKSKQKKEVEKVPETSWWSRIFEINKN